MQTRWSLLKTLWLADVNNRDERVIGLKTKFGIISTVVIVIAVAVGAVLINYNLHSTFKTMQFIEGRLRNGTFIDYDHSIDVESAEDLGWWKKDGNWYIMYGKLQLEFTPDQLRDPTFLEQVGRIGLDIRGDLDSGNLHFYWFNTELEEWVPR